MDDRQKYRKVYRTDNADLATYLMYNDIEFLGCEIAIDGITKKPKAIMMFNDAKETSRDLERMFYTSKEKRFRDMNKRMLKEIHKAVNRFKEQIFEQDDD